MCCNGVMFHIVRLQPGDSAKELAALGLKLKRKNKQDHIQQPCPAYRECQCSIYAQRPARCRLFECRQLQQLAEGQTTELAALARIQEALETVRQVHTLFQRAGETNEKRPLTKRYEKIMADPVDAAEDSAAAGLRTELTLAMQKLEALLENNFRVDGV
jgi:uncharacterized protein